MPLSLELHLDERQKDRVCISVFLKPDGEINVHGVELELRCPKNQGIGPRVLLPISGSLSGPIMTTAELRSEHGIPQGATVVGTVWSDGEQLVAQVPTDPCTGLEGHVRGCPRVGTQVDDRRLVTLNPKQCAALRRAMPWVGEAEVDDDEPNVDVTDDEMDHICTDLGLDGECAQWLKDLMSEEA